MKALTAGMEMRVEEIYDKNTARVLRSAGFSTVEAIVQMSRYDLPFGKGKADTVLNAAVGAIISRRVSSIEVADGEVVVECVSAPDDATLAAIKRALTCEYASVEVDGSRIVITKRSYGVPQWIRPDDEWERIRKYAAKWRSVLLAQHAEELREKIGAPVSVDEVRRLAGELGFDGFCKEFFADIKGNDVMKAALACSVFSTPEDPVNTLVIGPPGTAKTLALEIISQLEDVMTVGANVTRAGLVVNYASGELGILAYSDGKLVVIDEFDKAPPKDLQYTYELISKGRCDVHSGRIHETIRSKFILVALANPKGGVFNGEPLERISLDPPLVSRFALVVRSSELEGEALTALIFDKLMHGDAIRGKAELNAWVQLARRQRPKIYDAVEPKLRELSEWIAEEVVRKFVDTPLRRDNRMGIHARNMLLAIARAEFKDVDEETLETTREIISDSLKSWLNS